MSQESRNQDYILTGENSSGELIGRKNTRPVTTVPHMNDAKQKTWNGNRNRASCSGSQDFALQRNMDSPRGTTMPTRSKTSPSVYGSSLSELDFVIREKLEAQQTSGHIKKKKIMCPKQFQQWETIPSKEQEQKKRNKAFQRIDYNWETMNKPMNLTSTKCSELKPLREFVQEKEKNGHTITMSDNPKLRRLSQNVKAGMKNDWSEFCLKCTLGDFKEMGKISKPVIKHHPLVRSMYHTYLGNNRGVREAFQIHMFTITCSHNCLLYGCTCARSPKTKS